MTFPAHLGPHPSSAPATPLYPPGLAELCYPSPSASFLPDPLRANTARLCSWMKLIDQHRFPGVLLSVMTKTFERGLPWRSNG